MSPRPAATRSDPTARLFLDAAAELIDASLSPTSDNPPRRLRGFQFPAALDWLRIEDVVRMVADRPGGSRQAFHQRWQSKESFINDAVIYAMQYRDRPETELVPLLSRLPGLADGPVGDGVAAFAREFIGFVESVPRVFLMSHLAGHLDRHPELHRRFLESWLPGRQPLVQAFEELLGRLPVVLRPEWTTGRFDRALQALLDGVVLQSRLQPDETQADAWTHADLFAESVVALTLGALDTTRTGATAIAALTSAAAKP
ncbi:hypothetical protein [Microlunatus speluncae]|uniref:hypothetical protein n=1 Tax=Microlunatus speluncae TaxID=2594267 RepID=UPI00126670B0|nr:hypothetical protein [Microlunatus speluncae]